MKKKEEPPMWIQLWSCLGFIICAGYALNGGSFWLIYVLSGPVVWFLGFCVGLAWIGKLLVGITN